MNPEVMFDIGKINGGKDILRKKRTDMYLISRRKPYNFHMGAEPDGPDILKPEDLPSVDMKNNEISEENGKYLTLNCPMDDLTRSLQKIF